MNRYIKIFADNDALVSALGEEEILNPYVAYIEDGEYIAWNEPDWKQMPLTFECGSSGQISMVGNKEIEYTVNNGKTWNTLNSSNPIDVSEGTTVMFRGNTNSFDTSNHLAATATINKVEGNILSIYDKDNFKTIGISDSTRITNTIGGIFYNMSTIIDAGKLVLPSYWNTTGWLNGVFKYMFSGCTNLIIPPVLPLIDNNPGTESNPYTNQGSFYEMFRGCTSLTNAPELPSITLSPYCYQGMFYGCTSLTTAPELPATTISRCCYLAMFQDCTSLTNAPALPATTLVAGCYEAMFRGCTSLTTAPALPATTMLLNCYAIMFYGCSSLTTAPALPATTLAQSCYGRPGAEYTNYYSGGSSSGMFAYCTSLTTAPALPATTLASSCYCGMFQGCTSLTTAPDLLADTLLTECYRYMFSGCTSLNYIKCTATNISAYSSYEKWMQNIRTTGTFVKDANTNWPIVQYWEGTGILDNWTIVNV